MFQQAVARTEILPTNDPLALRRAADLLRRGGLVAFPTDTVYGVGALVSDPRAIAKLYEVKERGVEKAIPILLGDPGELSQVAVGVSEMALRLAARFWPGPLTLVLPKQPALPEQISSQPTIGVRMPAHKDALALMHRTGPLAVTSANLSGGANSLTAEQVMEQLGGRIPLILDGGRTPGGSPSTVVDCTRPEPYILRQGPVSLAEIMEVWAAADPKGSGEE
jgi:L-threonylcarbamoyladenylate synthase